MQKSMTKACCIAALTLMISVYGTAADQASAKDAAFFEERVKPILCGHCTSCHNEQLQASDLSFYTRKEVLDGGERGPSVVPYKPDQSILIHAINRDGGLMQFPVMMPPGPKLPDEDIETLTEWVRRGAPWGKESLACALGTPPPI
jgi:Planctomycete cytochrome C